jgi:hypothetical protein
MELYHEVVGKRVLVKSDNSTVVAYVNKQGGTRSPTLCLHARRLWDWSISHDIHLRAIHIPGIVNTLADNLSRGVSLSPTEWSLSKQVFQELYMRRGFLTVDLFASAANHQLPVYCSLANDAVALATDALSIPWHGMAAYAFPPISMIHRVLRKIAREDCVVLLIAPLWTGQYWFQMLTHLIVDYPILLPQIPDLLRIPGSKARFRLTAWTLSSNASRQRDFQKELPIWRQEDEENLQTEYTLRVYDYTTHGVTPARSLQIQHM